MTIALCTVVLAHHAAVHITVHRVSEGRRALSPPIQSHLRTSLSGTLMDPAQDRQRGTTVMCTLPQWPFISEYLTVALLMHSHTKPLHTFRDPFVPGGTRENVLVMCETYDKHGNPHPTNRRHTCDQVNLIGQTGSCDQF